GQGWHLQSASRRSTAQDQLPVQPGVNLPVCPGLVRAAQPFQGRRFRRRATLESGSQLVTNRRICRLKAFQFGLDLRGDNEGGELSGEQIQRTQRQCDQQNDGSDADEYVGDDQAVAQSPEHSCLEPAVGQNTKEEDGDNAEEPAPAAQGIACRRQPDSQGFFQQKGSEVENEEESRHPRQLALGQQMKANQPGTELEIEALHRSRGL